MRSLSSILAVIGIVSNILGLFRILEARQALSAFLIINHEALSSHLALTAAMFYIGTGCLILSVIVALSRKASQVAQ